MTPDLPSTVDPRERHDVRAGVRISVSAPTRLHFGLFSFGGPGRQFGGVGLMLDGPRVRVAVESSPEFHVRGDFEGRMRETVEAWCRFHGMVPWPACRVELLQCPPLHSGLGVGTQLALAIAAGLNRLFGFPRASAAELAASARRGGRSAVGTYGFLGGGLIVERGRLPGQTLSPLDLRLSVPEPWRIVLIRPEGEGLSGHDEETAFAEMPVVPPGVRRELIREVRQFLAPALAAGDFDAFAESLYRYGHRAGSCFQAVQGGPYNGAVLADLVADIRHSGLAGVGQSSWGPTLFVMFPDERAARLWMDRFRKRRSGDSLKLMLTRADNDGVWITELATPEVP